MQRIKFFIPLIIFTALAAMFYGVLKDEDYDPQALPSALLGKPVPAFDLSKLDLSRVDQTQLPKQLYLLNVWATWCPTCHAEHEYFNQLARSGVLIVGVNYKDDREAALKWLADKGNPYQFNIYDPEGLLGLDLGVYGAPETYVVDANGIILYKHIGAVDEQVWQEKLSGFFNSQR